MTVYKRKNTDREQSILCKPSDVQSKIISRRSKLQIYKTLIRPVVTYGAETWTLTATEENALRRFEREVLRKIYGPVVDMGGMANKIRQ